MFSKLHLKAIVFCYAIVSLPYAALALDLRYAQPATSHFSGRTSMTGTQEFSLIPVLDTHMRDVVVNSTTVVRNIPEHLQEVLYFRNHTMIGKKSEGFNVTQWEIDNNHPDRSHLTPLQRLNLGDTGLKLVGAGILAGVFLGVACIALSASCGTYIAANIGNFIRVATATGGEVAGQAAVGIVEGAIAGPLAAAGARKHRKRDDILYEDFGCFYEGEDSDVMCTNAGLAGDFFTAVTQNDGNTDQTPEWTCYEAADDDGTVYGYISHCFGDNQNCELQCGAGNPEVTDPVNMIAPPSN